jgi:DNA-binding MarR family transcriptional regulator
MDARRADPDFFGVTMKDIDQLKFEAPRVWAALMATTRREADWIDGEGRWYAWRPDAIAARCGIHVATVYRSARELQRAGWIIRRRMRHAAWVRFTHP